MIVFFKFLKVLFFDNVLEIMVRVTVTVICRSFRLRLGLALFGKFSRRVTKTSTLCSVNVHRRYGDASHYKIVVDRLSSVN